MVASIFTTAPNAAYAMLGVIPPDRRWCAFDTSMDGARRGKATKFAMTVWNYHGLAESDEFQEWAIKRDADTGAYWYRVARVKDGQDSGNRTHLWNSIHIAVANSIPMRAMLKDRESGKCAPEYVFDITQVLGEDDGKAVWLQLAVPFSGPGTETEVIRLPELKPLDDFAGSTRSSKISALQYEAACDLAHAIQTGRTTRSDALNELVEAYELKEGSASSLLNNYRCMVDGQRFVAPMSADAVRHFADRIVATQGPGAIPGIVAALEGFLLYSRTKLKTPSNGIAAFVNELREDGATAKTIEGLIDTRSVEAGEGGAKELVSEVLREVWTRGPQHAAFRRELERRWGNRCSVHGVSCNDQLRASHIVAWRLDKARRGDVNNGLLLSVPLDSLFDAGLISFSDAGHLMRSSELHEETCALFGLRPGLRLAWNHLREQSREGIRENLTRHRAVHAERHAFRIY